MTTNNNNSNDNSSDDVINVQSSITKEKPSVFTRTILNNPKDTLKARKFLASIEDTVLDNQCEIEIPPMPKLRVPSSSSSSLDESSSNDDAAAAIQETSVKVKYPILDAQDLMDWSLVNAHIKCALCYLHGMHSPCGKQLNKWQDCTLAAATRKSDSADDGETSEQDQECKEIFEREFFPCFAPIAASPYYRIRTSLLYSLPIPDLMDYWFRMQKRVALDNIYKKYH